jgi:hypothetical protein
LVGGRVRQYEPGDCGCGQRGKQSRQYKAQSQHSAQHFKRKERSAEWNTIGCRHACSGAAGYEKLALLVGEARFV